MLCMQVPKSNPWLQLESTSSSKYWNAAWHPEEPILGRKTILSKLLHCIILKPEPRSNILHSGNGWILRWNLHIAILELPETAFHPSCLSNRGASKWCFYLVSSSIHLPDTLFQYLHHPQRDSPEISFNTILKNSDQWHACHLVCKVCWGCGEPISWQVSPTGAPELVTAYFP